jgi:hypothetical protein
MWQYEWSCQTIITIYEVTYSTTTASNEELSYSDVILGEAETHEALTVKVADLIRKLGPAGNYYVDSIGGNPYETPPKKRIARKIAKDLDNLVSTINALILSRNREP